MTGLPGSGKSQLAHYLAPMLGLPVLDKDEWLEQAFDAKGVGDAAWRRQLSREADDEFQRDALRSDGAILVSFWHQPGMAVDSGTPTAWLRRLAGPVVVLHCACPPDVAVHRFVERRRHVGHLDHLRSPAVLRAQFDKLASLTAVTVGPVIDVPTTEPVDLEAVCRAVTAAWAAI